MTKKTTADANTTTLDALLENLKQLRDAYKAGNWLKCWELTDAIWHQISSSLGGGVFAGTGDGAAELDQCISDLEAKQCRRAATAGGIDYMSILMAILSIIMKLRAKSA